MTSDETINKIGVIVLLIIGFILINFAVSKMTSRQIRKLKNNSKISIGRKITSLKLMQSSFKYISMLTLLIVILVVAGVPLGTIVASAGLFSIAIGFGAKSLVEDFISGFFIYFEQQYDVGDVILVNDFKGEVISLGFKTTTLKNWLGDIYVVRNGTIDGVTNFSVENSVANVILKVDSDTDLSLVDKLVSEDLNEILKDNEKIVNDILFVGVNNISVQGIEISITAEVKPMKNIEIERLIRKEILILFNENNICLAKASLEI